MKRPLCVMGTGLFIAIAVAFCCSVRQSLLLSLAMVLTGVIIGLLKQKKTKAFAVFCLSAGIGLALGAYYVNTKIQPFEVYFGQPVRIQGIVTERKSTSTNSTRYTLQASFPNTNLPDSSFVLRGFGDDRLEVGDAIQTTVILQTPDYLSTQQYYLRSGIPAEGYLEETVEFFTPNGLGEKLTQSLALFRQSIQNKLYRALPSDSAALTAGMVFGMTDGLSSELYSSLNQSGTSHMLSVSGMHMSIFSGFVLFLLSRLRTPKHLQAVIAISANLAFTILVGFSAPLVRSFIMSTIMLLTFLIPRQSDPLSSLGLSAVLIAFFRPFWILSLGTWLSFLSTAGIIICGVPLSQKLILRYKRRRSKWYNRLVSTVIGGLCITLGAYLFTIPLLAIQTGWISIISPLSNLLISPFASIITIGGMFCSLVPQDWFLLKIISAVVDFSCRMVVSISDLFANLPFATYAMDYWWSVPLLLLGIGAIFFTWYRPKEKRRWAAVFAAIALALSSVGLFQQMSNQNKIEWVSLEDVQTQILIQNTHCILLGTPDRYETDQIINYLDFRGVKTIDALFFYDADFQIHSGILRLSNNFSVSSCVIPKDEVALDSWASALPNIPVYPTQMGMELQLFGTTTICLEQLENPLIQIGSTTLLKTEEEYVILNQESLPNWYQRWSPIASNLFGETSIMIST